MVRGAQDEGEKYKFGASALLDSLLAPNPGRGGPSATAGSPRGRSASVPLVGRRRWQVRVLTPKPSSRPARPEALSENRGGPVPCRADRAHAGGPCSRGRGGGQSEELPSELGGISLAPAGSALAAPLGGAHLPSTMQRLRVNPASAQGPPLAPPGAMGLAPHAVAPRDAMVPPSPAPLRRPQRRRVRAPGAATDARAGRGAGRSRWRRSGRRCAARAGARARG